MPRTTIDLDATVLDELRARVQRERRPLGVIASQLLAQAMAPGADVSSAPAPLAWVSQSMGARVDLSDREAVHAALDAEDARG